MDDKNKRARDIQEQINKILYEDWAPLGFIKDLPTDEYESYVGGVYRLLASGASCEAVAAHLTDLEHQVFGYDQATVERNMPAARKLCELDTGL